MTTQNIFEKAKTRMIKMKCESTHFRADIMSPYEAEKLMTSECDYCKLYVELAKKHNKKVIMNIDTWDVIAVMFDGSEVK